MQIPVQYRAKRAAVGAWVLLERNEEEQTEGAVLGYKCPLGIGTSDTLDTIMQYWTGPTTVQVDSYRVSR